MAGRCVTTEREMGHYKIAIQVLWPRGVLEDSFLVSPCLLGFSPTRMDKGQSRFILGRGCDPSAPRSSSVHTQHHLSSSKLQASITVAPTRWLVSFPSSFHLRKIVQEVSNQNLPGTFPRSQLARERRNRGLIRLPTIAVDVGE